MKNETDLLPIFKQMDVSFKDIQTSKHRLRFHSENEFSLGNLIVENIYIQLAKFISSKKQYSFNYKNGCKFNFQMGSQSQNTDLIYI